MGLWSLIRNFNDRKSCLAASGITRNLGDNPPVVYPYLMRTVATAAGEGFVLIVPIAEARALLEASPRVAAVHPGAERQRTFNEGVAANLLTIVSVLLDAQLITRVAYEEKLAANSAVVNGWSAKTRWAGRVEAYGIMKTLGLDPSDSDEKEEA